jgi:hypothetical protein
VSHAAQHLWRTGERLGLFRRTRARQQGLFSNITPHEQGIGDWSSRDIVSALKTGILPDFDTFGGSMIAVQENMAKLTADDLEAIAAYLKSLPPKPSRWKIVKAKDP